MGGKWRGRGLVTVTVTFPKVHSFWRRPLEKWEKNKPETNYSGTISALKGSLSKNYFVN